MYIILCLAAVFAALVEFACINFIDTFIKRFKKWEEEHKISDESKAKESLHQEPNDAEDMIQNGQIPNTSTDMPHIDDEELVEVVEKGKVDKHDQNPFIPPLAKSECISTVSFQDACVSTEDDDFEDCDDDEEDNEPRPSVITRLVEWCDEMFDRALKRIFRKYHPMISQMKIYTETVFVIHSIDDFSRKGFPLVFLCLQILYWTLHLYIL